MARTKKPIGVVLYEGPSLLDGAPIVVVATFESDNEKTGNMIQTWILRTDVSPVVAVSSGQDSTICGDCPLRGVIARRDDGTTKNVDRVCYVDHSKAPNQVWRTFHAGRYPRFNAEEHARYFIGRSFRAGSYGDPTASPYDAWATVYQIVRKRRTGYTHQFATCDQRWKDKLMASAESEDAYRRAKALGWRVFRTKPENAPTLPGEKVCPASAESGYVKTCETCLACNGVEFGRGDIVINAHGSAPKMHSIARFFGE
jgi:hypothetical protein